MEKRLHNGREKIGRSLTVSGAGAIAKLTLVNVLVAAGNFAAGVVAARALGPEGRGQLASLLLWPALSANLATLGVHMELARSTARDSRSASRNYHAGSRILAWTSTGAVALYMAVVAILSGLFTSVTDSSLLMFAVIIVPFGVGNALQLQMELSRQNFSTYGMLRIAYTYVNVLLIALLWLNGAVQVKWYLLAFVISSMLSWLFAHILIYNDLMFDDGDVCNNETWRSIAWAARHFALASALLTLNGVADRLIVSVFFESQVMGLYVVALSISQLQDLVGDAIAQFFFVRVAANNNIRCIDREWLALRLRQTVFIYILSSCCTLIFAPVMILLFFGEQFYSSIILIYELVPIFMLKSAMRPFEEVLKGAGKPLNQAWISAITMVGFAIGGGIGAWFGCLEFVIFALWACAMATFVALARTVAREIGVGLPQILIPRPSDVIGLGSQLLATQRYEL